MPHLRIDDVYGVSDSGLTFARKQRGEAMIEFSIVGPIITLIGLASLQYTVLFLEKAVRLRQLHGVACGQWDTLAVQRRRSLP